MSGYHEKYDNIMMGSGRGRGRGRGQRGGFGWSDIKNIGREVASVGKDAIKFALPLAPLAISAYKAYKGGKGKVIKDAPKKTPQQLKPFMRVVETVRSDRRYAHLPYSQQLKVASKVYRSM